MSKVQSDPIGFVGFFGRKLDSFELFVDDVFADVEGAR